MPCGVLIALFLVDNSSYLFSLLSSFLVGVTILLSLTVFLNMVAETMVDNETSLKWFLVLCNNLSSSFTAGHFRRCASFR
jgi:hypothetical protein